MKGRSMILVVDDDKKTCRLISAALAAKGYGTAVAYNGREALDYLKGADRRPSLILLDLMMPEMNGWEFRKAQQSDPALADIPVAIITGLEGGGEGVSSIGAVDVLYKPSRIENLTALVSRFCDN
ncbi:MAG TPA: response regulator [Elusimicrobia bacterium]|nr:response regulator [Elusimicrobiota bacterium]